jgi:hypothetical protein
MNDIPKEVRFVGAIVIILMILGCYLLAENTDVMRDANDISRERQEIDLRSEYERVVLGCNTQGAVVSEDPLLRELCDETLFELREEVFGE